MHEFPESRINFKKLRRFSQFALGQGALRTKIISVRTIEVAPWVKLKCQYRCKNYGKSNVCPPNSPNPFETRSIFNNYEKAILIRGENKITVTRIALETEREAFLSGCYRAFAFGAGPCMLSLNEDVTEYFENNEQIRPLMEGVGIDVFRSARNNGFRIEVTSSPEIKPHYFSLVLIE